jgi:hypothetical protein
MRRIYHTLLAALIAAAPMPVAAQVTVDLNALNGLGGASLPAPPPGAPATASHPHHRLRHLARTGRESHPPKAQATAVASTTQAPAGPETIEHPTNLGSSFTSLPSLPASAPPLPAPPPTLATPAKPPTPKPPTPKPPTSKPVETAAAAPKPEPAPKTAPAAPAPPQLVLPDGVPPPPPTPTRLAEATPAPPAAAQPGTLPAGADRLTLPFFVQESDLPPAETAMLRDFAARHGADAHYVIRAYATPPAGDDDPSTPRRIALMRAQSVASALTDSGIQADRVRLLALGNAGGAPADRVEVIAMPPSSGHTSSDTDSSP